MSSRWSEEERRLAVSLAQDMTYAEVAAMLGRTTQAVHYVLHQRMKVRRWTTTYWSEDEERLAVTLAGELTQGEIAALLGRTEAMVQGKLYGLGIRPGRPVIKNGRWWTPEEIHMLRTLGPRHLYKDIALLMKRSTESVRSMAKIVGVVKLLSSHKQEELVPPELREVIDMLDQLKRVVA